MKDNLFFRSFNNLNILKTSGDVLQPLFLQYFVSVEDLNY